MCSNHIRSLPRSQAAAVPGPTPQVSGKCQLNGLGTRGKHSLDVVLQLTLMMNIAW